MNFQFEQNAFQGFQVIYKYEKTDWYSTGNQMLKSLLRMFITHWKTFQSKNYVFWMSHLCKKNIICGAGKALKNKASFLASVTVQILNKRRKKTKFDKSIQSGTFFPAIIQMVIKKNFCWLSAAAVLEYASCEKYASVAQSVEQLIRNQQVVCSSQITSSSKKP